MIKASKALNFMEAAMEKKENELQKYRARLMELEASLTTTTHMTTLKDSSHHNHHSTANDCNVTPEGAHLPDHCRTDVSENPMLKTLEGENESLRCEVGRLQDVLKDMMSQMDQLMEHSHLSIEKIQDQCKEGEQEALHDLEELRTRNKELETLLDQAQADLEGTAKNLDVST